MTELTEVTLWKRLREGSLSANPVVVRSKGYVYGGSDPIIIPPDIQEVPSNITFRGDVVCKEGNLTTFHATVQGAALFENLPIFSTLSGNAHFLEVSVVNCPITTFEAQVSERAKFYEIQNLILGNITFGGVLTLDDCSLRTFNAHINGNAEFDHVVFPKSGMNPRFGGVVKMWHCDLQEFNLPVNGDLHISYAKLQSIGAQTVINGNLYLKDVDPGIILNCTVDKICYLRVTQWELGSDARIKRFSLEGF